MLLRLLFLVPLLAVAAGVDVTGTWRFAVDTTAGAGEPTFVLKQTGETLTGSYSGALGEAPLKGTVKGNAIEFQFKIEPQGETIVAEYKGTVESATSMKGTMKYGTFADGTWTAKKEK